MAKRGPGKFDSDLDAAVYGLSLDGGPDEEAGDSTEGSGWYGLMRDGGEIADAIEERQGFAPDEVEGVTSEDLEFLRSEGKAGAIIFERTDGGVSVTYYDSMSDLDKDWAEVEAETSGGDEEFEENRRHRNGEEDTLRDETIEPFLEGKGPVFRIQTWETGKYDQHRLRRDRPLLGYRITMTEPGGAPEVVFEGEDYSPGAFTEPDSDQTLNDILAFFTNDYEDETRTARQRAVVQKYGDYLSGHFEEEAGREENGTGRQTVTRTDKMPGRAGMHKYRGATVWISGPASGTWWATIKFRNQEKDVDAKSYEGVLDAAKDWIDAAPELKRNGQARFRVYLSGELTDTVYFSDDMSEDEVRRSLINHDGYDSRIVVKKVEPRRTGIPAERYVENRPWSRAHINDLPDSAFLYIEPGGKKDRDGRTTPRSLRHFPYKTAAGAVDQAHLRNALSRIPQSKLPADVKRRVKEKAQALYAERR